MEKRVTIAIRYGDCRDILRTLPDQSVHCCVTSPPYFGLRDYGHADQIGLEATPDAYVAEIVAVFREVHRVLRDDGTLWLNVGDSYAGGGSGGGGSFEKERNWRVGNLEKNNGNSNRDGLGRVTGLKPKDLIGIPWRVAFALQADGWYLRQDIIWSKPNPMPESVTDRCTKAHEYIFLMSKSARYFYDAKAIAEAVTQSTVERLSQPNLENQFGSDRVPGKINGNMKAVGGETRNKRSVWEVATQPFSETHFAVFPCALIEPCIKAGCPIGGTVLDPFAGAGTTGMVADRLQRDALLIELNADYTAMMERRIRDDAGMFAEVHP
jgi:DNA modification methylase